MANAADMTTVTLDWTPITYTADTGGYEVYFDLTSGEPYTYYDITMDKLASSIIVNNLNPDTTYYITIQTVTHPHANNQNTVRSESSIEVFATTLPAVPALGLISVLLLLGGLSGLLLMNRIRTYRRFD